MTDEITVQPGCKKFTCEYPKTTCAKLVKAGSPLDKPVAATLLPNGNLIVANTGNNTLVEMTPTGQVLDTKVMDKARHRDLWARRDWNDRRQYRPVLHRQITNTLHELEQ